MSQHFQRVLHFELSFGELVGVGQVTYGSVISVSGHDELSPGKFLSDRNAGQMQYFAGKKRNRQVANGESLHHRVPALP